MSAVLSSIASDYAFIDGLESVTLTPQNPAGSAINNVKAHMGQLTQAELAFVASVGMERRTAAWILWDSALGSTVPKNGDKITTAGGATWIIIDAADVRTGAYRCLAYQHT